MQLKTFFQSYQNYNFEYAKKNKSVCHTSHRSKVLGPWSTIYPNLGLVDYQACPGLERHGSAGGHPTPPNIFKSQYFHIETHSFGLQQKSHGKMHPARSPFSELYRGLNKLPVLVICFLPAIFGFWMKSTPRYPKCDLLRIVLKALKTFQQCKVHVFGE